MQKLSFRQTVSGSRQFLRATSFLLGSLTFIFSPCIFKASLLLVSSSASSGMVTFLKQLLLLRTSPSMRLLQMEMRRGQKVEPRFLLTVLQSSALLVTFDLKDTTKGTLSATLMVFFIRLYKCHHHPNLLLCASINSHRDSWQPIHIKILSLKISQNSNMNYNQELYREFKERKASRHNPQTYVHTYKRRAVLQKFIQLPDRASLSLQSSIPLLKNLGVIHSIESVDHIVELMDMKKRGSQGWEGAENELWECRLIYFLWDVIGKDSIEMREFKELLLVLIGSDGNRQEAIEQLFGSRQEISQLIETWDHIFLEEGEEEEINDISIIKSKNEGNIGDNKENMHDYNNEGYITDRNLNKFEKSKHSRNKSRLEKSYSKRTAKTAIEKSNSVGHITTKRSEHNSLANYISAGVKPITFFRQTDSLSTTEEKQLVDRLYNCDVYRQREEQKKQLEEERRKAELQSCTFKPQIRVNQTQSRMQPSYKDIKGYQQAVQRIKSGYQKKRELQQNLQYRMWKEGPSLNGKPTIGYAPKFHQRQPKEQRSELFQLKFTLGRLLIPVKIRQSDKVGDLVSKIGRIYSLKEYQKVYINDSIIQALEEYSALYGPSEFEQE